MQQVKGVNTLKQDPRPTILVVDDSRVNQEVLVTLLSHDYHVKVAGNGMRAIEIAQQFPIPSLILLDIHMPEMDGYEVCRQLQENVLTEDIAIIFVTSLSNQESEAYGLKLGAVDYISKPISPEITLLRVRNQILLKQHEDELKSLAHYDGLTGIPNRMLLQDRLKLALAASARSGRKGALLFIDMDNFKVLNDTLGHDMGDLLLQQVALRLESCMREGDTVARLGGDEFVVMLEDLSEQLDNAATQAEVIGKKILSSLNEPYQLTQHKFNSTPSIGITLICGHDISMTELLKQADIAMYQAKASGRNTMKFFDPQMQANINARVALEADLRQSLLEGRFLIYFQAQLFHHKIIGAEALIRWQHPQQGLMLPASFIPLAEETGLILPIGQWVLEAACAQLSLWAGSAQTEHLQLSINISAYQFRQPGFVAQVIDTIERNGVKPGKLRLELTESLFFVDINDAIVKMNTLRDFGVYFSMDDFGTGFSSLSSLKKLPIEQLKIDRSFVSDVATNSDDAIIIQTIIAMTKNMGMNVIAEGVETEAQQQFLDQQGCSYYQGYLFSKPVPIEQFEALLRDEPFKKTVVDS
ncbi:MAG: EAL domain-containing protein [Methyloprofundus sp.]|nr:EAL domain-containing protein [Methyloprofundus sp.]